MGELSQSVASQEVVSINRPTETSTGALEQEQIRREHREDLLLDKTFRAENGFSPTKP